jgi:hypothetical protein
MILRLLRLEDRASMQRNEAGETAAEVLRGRILRLCEAEGVPFEDLPTEELPMIWAVIFPSPIFCGGLGDLAPKRKAFRLPPELDQVVVRAGEATDNTP